MGERSPVAGGRHKKATVAAAALAICSLGVQVTNFVRSDLKPVIDAVHQSTATMQRIEKKLDNHEQRLIVIEGVLGVDDGTGELDQKNKTAYRRNSRDRRASREVVPSR
jgi:hypothetical protein